MASPEEPDTLSLPRLSPVATTSNADTEACDISHQQEPKAVLSNEEKPTKKRKFVFDTNTGSSKRCRKFYFINNLMTKPRRPKVPNVIQDKVQQHLTPNRKYKSHYVKRDANGNLYLVHRSAFKTDLFFNHEKKHSYEPFKRFDLAFHIVDEIALEGLDGITLEAFWKRLKNVFPNNINKDMADRIWRFICNNKHITFYVLKDPREELVFFDRCKLFQLEVGAFLEPFVEFKDIYPLVSVNGSDIRGSCSTFETRKENNGVRRFSMGKTLKLYGQRIVIVADQALRNKALISEEADPNNELIDLEYCLLEKIGRTRDHGDFTQGTISLNSDNKKIYHHRKSLLQDSLVVQQSCFFKSMVSQQNVTGSLVHLPRFFHKRKSKYIAIMERMSEVLKAQPNFQMEFAELRNLIGNYSSWFKVLKVPDFKKFFKMLLLPYRKVYPNAAKEQYFNRKKGVERQVRALRLIDPCANISALMESKDSKRPPAEKTDTGCGKKSINYEYLRDIYMYIYSTGTQGVTLQEIFEYFKTDFYSVRLAVKKLITKNVIGSHKIDSGRQQTLKFFAIVCTRLLSVPIKTEPRFNELSDETVSRALSGYANLNFSDFPCEPEEFQMAQTATAFKLEFEPFCCTAFLTETIDASSEELTIYDIVVKGRDKLLLIGSNLFVHYLSEWDGFILQKEPFAKGVPLFQTGFGKDIYDFLTTINLSEKFEADNRIIFQAANINSDTRINVKVGKQWDICKNYRNPHSDKCYIDTISKIYQFEAMFNEFHKAQLITDKLKSIFERVMLSEGKTKTTQNVAKPVVKLEAENCSVAMEKFMGDAPVLEWSSEEEDITIEIFSSTKPRKVKPEGSFFYTDETNFTQRYINRANLILKSIYEKQIVKDVSTLYKDILNVEDVEGYDKKACKKSIVTIVGHLVADGYIKCFKLVMTGKNTVRSHCFMCVHEMGSDNALINATIEQMKLKFFVSSAPTPKPQVQPKNDSPFNSLNVKESITEWKQLTKIKTEIPTKVDRSKGKTYGYAPKFIRMRILHELLFYLVREVKDWEPLPARDVAELCKSMKLAEINELPPIYSNEINWKMFIPAMPQNAGWPKGWALACDVVLRMPLSIFVKLYNVPYEVPGLENFLNHPIKRHYLLKHLPVYIRNFLLHRRRYFHSIYDNLFNLCYIGLLQLGPRNFKEKDQLFLYLNAKASLFDTCSSAPGYHHVEDKAYKKVQFEFRTGKDVEIYWSELLRICMNTRLGKRKILDGQIVTIEDCASKPAMRATVKARKFDEAVKNDTGEIPGDRKGSAGFDSSLWSFVKRNWAWNAQGDKTEIKKDKPDLILPAPVKYADAVKDGYGEFKIRKRTAKKAAKAKKVSKKKFLRKITMPRRKKRIREYCDAVDKMIMKKNPGVRVDWSEEEEQLLRYCRIASLFLCPVFKKQFIPYNVLRDVLHRIHPTSKNKTARAIQRRIYVLLTHDEAMKIMETNVENLLNSETVSKYFEQIHNRYKNGIKITDAQLYIAFVYLMSYMGKHRKEMELLLLGYFASFDFFSEKNIQEFENLVSTCADSSNAIYSNPKSVEEVTGDTIKSVIHCSMACRKNTIGWTYHLSRIYQKFKEDSIRQTVNSLRKDQFFVSNKNSEGKNVEAFPAPIKFSQVYNLMKTSSYTIDMYKEAFRNFLSKFGQSTNGFIDCNEICTFWEGTNIVFDIPEMGIILNPDIADHGEVIDELARRFRIYLEQIVKKNAKRSDDVPDEGQNEEQVNEIKDEVRHLIFRVPYLLEGEVEGCFKDMLHSDNRSVVNGFIRQMIGHLKHFADILIEVQSLQDFIAGVEQNVDDSEKLINSLSKLVFAIQNFHQYKNEPRESFDDVFKEWETEIWNEVRLRTGDKESKIVDQHYANGMENCIKRAQAGDFPSIEEIQQGIVEHVDDAENRKMPHVTDLIMLLNEDKFPELDTDVDTIERMKDHFVMQYPKLEQFVIEDLEALKQAEATTQILNKNLDEVRRKSEKYAAAPQLDLVLGYIHAKNGSDLDVKITENVIDAIKGKGALGMSAQQLQETFANRLSIDLAELMEFLDEIGVVLRTGVATFVYVHYDYQDEWLTETFVLSEKEKEIFQLKEKQEMKKNLKVLIDEKLPSSEPRKVQLRPWSKLDGFLNDEVFHDWLCVILSRCIDFPNVPFLVLCEQFQYIKPVDVYFLLEVLQQLGCVKICVLKSVGHDGLFCSRSVVDECEATCLDKFEDVFVKTLNTSALSFGCFLENSIFTL